MYETAESQCTGFSQLYVAQTWQEMSTSFSNVVDVCELVCLEPHFHSSGLQKT